MLVGAWEEGLEGVEDSAVELIVQAVEQQLKRMLFALLKERNGYKSRKGIGFQHSVGCPVPNPYFHSTQKYLAGTSGYYFLTK